MVLTARDVITAIYVADSMLFQVLNKWHNEKFLKVKDVIAEMVKWTWNGFLDLGVWNNFQFKINEAMLPANIKTLVLPAPPSGPRPQLIALMVSTGILVNIVNIGTEHEKNGSHYVSSGSCLKSGLDKAILVIVDLYGHTSKACSVYDTTLFSIVKHTDRSTV